MEIIRIRNLSCGYIKKIVLHNVTFSAKSGEILILVGPNGSGKTTLLRALSGYIKPTGGNIFLCGEDINQIPAHKVARKVASVPQNLKVSWPFEVYEVVRLGRFPYRGWISTYKKKDNITIKNALKTTGVWNLRNRRIDTLSGGEFQRVIIAKALAQTPKVLLLDEPVAHLDIKHKINILDLIDKYAKSGITCILSLHDLNLAGLYADRIVLLNEGEVFALGSPTSILTKKNIEEVYKTKVEVKKIDKSGKYIIIPISDRETRNYNINEKQL